MKDKTKNFIGWIGVGILGAATALLGQWCADRSTKKEVEAYMEQHPISISDEESA